MSKVISISQFKEDHGPDLIAKERFLAMSTGQLWDEIISFKESILEEDLDEPRLRKAMALFDVAHQKSDSEFLKMFSEMYLNHLKQEMKVLKNTYSK